MRFEMMMGQHGAYVTAIHREPGEPPCSVCGSEDVRTHWNLNAGAAGGATVTDMQALCGACATKRGITYLKTLEEMTDEWAALRAAAEEVLDNLYHAGVRHGVAVESTAASGDQSKQVARALAELESHWPALRKPQ